MDNWIQVTAAARSVIGRRLPASYQMGVSGEITRTIFGAVGQQME